MDIGIVMLCVVIGLLIILMVVNRIRIYLYYDLDLHTNQINRLL